ncbi:hypothetical protein PCE1_004779 [Barthelona sp. PCE]
MPRHIVTQVFENGYVGCVNDGEFCFLSPDSNELSLNIRKVHRSDLKVDADLSMLTKCLCSDNYYASYKRIGFSQNFEIKMFICTDEGLLKHESDHMLNIPEIYYNVTNLSFLKNKYALITEHASNERGQLIMNVLFFNILNNTIEHRIEGYKILGLQNASIFPMLAVDRVSDVVYVLEITNFEKFEYLIHEVPFLFNGLDGCHVIPIINTKLQLLLSFSQKDHAVIVAENGEYVKIGCPPIHNFGSAIIHGNPFTEDFSLSLHGYYVESSLFEYKNNEIINQYKNFGSIMFSQYHYVGNNSHSMTPIKNDGFYMGMTFQNGKIDEYWGKLTQGVLFSMSTKCRVILKRGFLSMSTDGFPYIDLEGDKSFIILHDDEATKHLVRSTMHDCFFIENGNLYYMRMSDNFTLSEPLIENMDPKRVCVWGDSLMIWHKEEFSFFYKGQWHRAPFDGQPGKYFTVHYVTENVCCASNSDGIWLCYLNDGDMEWLLVSSAANIREICVNPFNSDLFMLQTHLHKFIFDLAKKTMLFENFHSCIYTWVSEDVIIINNVAYRIVGEDVVEFSLEETLIDERHCKTGCMTCNEAWHFSVFYDCISDLKVDSFSYSLTNEMLSKPIYTSISIIDCLTRGFNVIRMNRKTHEMKKNRSPFN